MAYQNQCKVIFILIDGIADVGNSELGGLTYLQYATLPNFDKLAQAGITGTFDPVETGLGCGSDTAHMSLFEYDPMRNYKGRGSFETIGAGIPMEVGDIAFKCNFATIENGIVTRRRVSRSFPEWGLPLCDALNNQVIPEYPEYQMSVLHATEHRCGIRIRGPNLTHNITDTDPLRDGRVALISQPADLNDPLAQHTANVVNAADRLIRKILGEHPINVQRGQEEKPQANIVLLRGCGIKLDVPSFEEKHGLRGFFIAPTAIIKGLGDTIRMDIVDVEGATGDVNSNFKAKFDRAAELIREDRYNFGFVHIKGIDDTGHDKTLDKRVELIQRLDQIIGDFLRQLENENIWVVLTGDHTTTTITGDHSFEAVPVAFCRLSNFKKLDKGEAPDERIQDGVASFDEIECSKGALGRFAGHEMMSIVRSVINI